MHTVTIVEHSTKQDWRKTENSTIVSRRNFQRES